MLALPVGTWFSAIYLGEHYVVDVLGGIGYGLAAFILVEKVLPPLTVRFGFLRKNVPKLETGYYYEKRKSSEED